MSNPTIGQQAYIGGAATKVSYFDWKDILALGEKAKESDIVNTFYAQKLAPYFNLLTHSLENDTWHLLNLEEYEKITSSVFRFLKVIKRYRALHQQMDKLNVGNGAFIIGDSTFETLDEVEKAIKNKAFL